MKSMLYCRVLAVGIIVLFIGVGIHPVFANVVNKSLVDDNHPPYAPAIDGPKLGRPGTHEWTFCATDPDGDNVSYQIDWDDGTYENWTDFYPSGEVITRRHTYNIYGDFELDAYAKDIHGLIGPKGTYPVIMTKSKHTVNTYLNDDSIGNPEVEPLDTKSPVVIQQSEEDCNCKDIDNRHLVILERQLNRLEVYSKLLLILSKHNPELKEISEELSNRISTLRETNDDRIICNILKAIAPIMILIVGGFVHYIQEFEDNPIIRNILIVVFTPFFSLYLSMVIIGVLYCGLEPFSPEIWNIEVEI